ncbi:MAG: energy transducer TonB [Cyanobacteria bacterium P01_D01_bin.1]
MWRVLAVGAVVAGGVHIFSLPWISRMVSGGEQSEPEIEATPIEIVVEEELVQQTTEELEPEPPEENPEPVASAERPSAAPLATTAEPLPTSPVAAADTVAVAPAIATENGTVDGQGAEGDSSVIGLVRGSGEPIEQGDRINLPEPEPEPISRPRAPVQEISLAARRAPTSRVISCNPCTSPDYPTTARRERNEGQPVINAIFDGNGRVISAEIEVSSGNAAFDRAALEEARRNWRFQDPLGIGGQVSVDVVYVIDDSEQAEEEEQAGEIRAVELPTAQQVQEITPDQAPPPAATPPAVNQTTEQTTEQTDQAADQDAESQVLENQVPEIQAPEIQAPESQAPEPVDSLDEDSETLTDTPVETDLTTPAPEISTPPTPTPAAPVAPAMPPANATEPLVPDPFTPKPSAPEPSAPEPSAPEPSAPQTTGEQTD